VAKHLAFLYSDIAAQVEAAKEQAGIGEGEAERGQGNTHLAFFMTHKLLPALRAHLILPHECTVDGTITQIAALEQLYKIFERC